MYVDFGGGKGRVNMSAQMHTSGVCLVGGLRIGERMQSLIHHNKTLKEGDEGVVISPCGDLQAADASARVCVDFSTKGRV